MHLWQFIVSSTGCFLAFFFSTCHDFDVFIIIQFSDGFAHIGAYRENDTATFSWVSDNSLLTWSNWLDDYPVEGHTEESAVMVNKDGEWLD